MDWTLQGSNSGGNEIFRTRPDRPEVHAACYTRTIGNGPFSGVKPQGRGADQSPPSSVQVEGSVELYIFSLSGPSWRVLG